MAGLLPRFFATIFDTMLVSFISTPLIALMSASGVDPAVKAVVIATCIASYEVVTVSRFGGTAGKRVFRIRVVMDDETLERPGLLASVERYVVKTGQPTIALLFLVLSMRIVTDVSIVYLFVVALTLLFSRVNRGIHDRLAQTYVVSLREPVTVTDDLLFPGSDDRAATGPRPAKSSGRKKKSKKKKRKG
jgi:uncharacterized RDD family membrane protein YckC